MLKHLVENELEEYRAILDEVAAGTKSTGERAAELDRLLLDAEQAGRRWATEALRDSRLSGHAKLVKAHMKAPARVVAPKVDRSTVIGVRRGAKATWHQVPLDDVLWSELEASTELTRANAKALRANVRFNEKILELREQVPESTGPGDALRQLDTTLEQFLGAA